MTIRAAALALVVLITPGGLAGAVPASAQGNRGAPPGQLKKPPTSDSSNRTTPAASPVPTITPRSFGVWLDDATLVSPGAAWITLAATGWSAPSGHGVDAPSFGLAAGLNSRAQLSITVPYSRVSTPDASATSKGLGDLYAGIKLLVVDRTQHRVGVSFAPTLEVLSAISANRRTGVVLPISIEGGTDTTRVYGSTGYFSRGAVFVSGAIERHVSAKVALTGALTQSWSTADAAATDALGLRGTRTDASGAVAAFLTPAFAVYASAGRTLSPIEYDGSRYVLSAGLAFALTPASQVPVRPPR